MWLAARLLQFFHILLLYDGLVLPRRHACPHDAASSGRTLIVRTPRPHDATQHRWTRRPDDAPPRREDIMASSRCPPRPMTPTPVIRRVLASIVVAARSGLFGAAAWRRSDEILTTTTDHQLRHPVNGQRRSIDTVQHFDCAHLHFWPPPSLCRLLRHRSRTAHRPNSAHRRSRGQQLRCPGAQCDEG